MTKPRTKPQASGWFEYLLARPYQTIFLISVLLYAQILTFGLVHFDDHGFVLMASDTLKLSSIPQFFQHSVFWVLGDTTQDTDVFYRPLQNVIYGICNTIAPRQAWIYHCFGLMLHALTACALFRFFKELKFHVSVALAFALIYSVHPVLVQGVAWIAGIGDQMATLFCLLSVVYFIKFISADIKTAVNVFFIHIGLFACALFSKEVSIMLIPVLLVWYFFINSNRVNKKLLWISLNMWIVTVIVYFIFRNAAIHPAKTNLFVSAFESFKANGPLLFEYFEKIFLPYRLSPIPSREDAQVLVGLIVFVAFISLLIFRKKFTRMFLFGILWFLAFLLPTFIQQNPQAHFFAFEHRLYLPLIGLVIMCIELLDLKQISFNSNAQKFGFSLFLLLFAFATLAHSRTFKDPYTFYDKALASSPRSVIAYNGYGKLLLEDRKYAEAIEAFKKSYEYKSDDLQTTGKIADIYLKNLNNPREAVVWFKKTLDIAPNSIEAAVSLGDACFNFLKDTANAILWYEHSLKIDPKNEFASASLGVIHAGKGQNEQARTHLMNSIQTNPRNLLALKWMAILYYNEGRISEAVSYLDMAYGHYPDDVDLLRNLMICYYKLNNRILTEKFSALLAHSGNPIPAEIENYLNAK